MADINIAVIRDSVQRSVYKDLICLLNNNRYLSKKELLKKGELNFMQDKWAGIWWKKGEDKNSVKYRECRL